MSDFRNHYMLDLIGSWNPGQPDQWSDEYLVWNCWNTVGQYHEFLAKYGETDTKGLDARRRLEQGI